MRHLLALLLAFGLCVPQAATAQSLNTAMWGSVSKGHRNATRSVNRQLFAPVPTPATPRGQARVDFSYDHDRARTSRNLQRFVERTPDPAAKADLERMIAAQPGIMEDIRRGIRPYGLDSHDVADAYAMWWINAWLAYEGLDQDTPRGTVAMVRQQVRNAFAASPDLAMTGDADRQEYAEALLLQGLMLSAAVDQLKGDPEAMRQLSRSVNEGAKASGLDLATMRLTANGFVPRAGADASGVRESAMPGAQDLLHDVSAGPGEALDTGAGDDAGMSPLMLAVGIGAVLGAAGLAGYSLARRG